VELGKLLGKLHESLYLRLYNCLELMEMIVFELSWEVSLIPRPPRTPMVSSVSLMLSVSNLGYVSV